MPPLPELPDLALPQEAPWGVRGVEPPFVPALGRKEAFPLPSAVVVVLVAASAIAAAAFVVAATAGFLLRAETMEREWGKRAGAQGGGAEWHDCESVARKMQFVTQVPL